MPAATQKIFRIRRDYNTWVANETLEDYALRYTPRSFRRWSEFRVANTAFGAVSFLALEAIGGAIALNYGFANALWAVLIVGLITFLTGLPISYYAARYGVDMDLLTRGAGFGYLGSTLTSLIYASFTFIFFALEAAIMALALQMCTGLPMWACYLASSLVVIPLVTHGITLISRLQLWTQPVWLVLLVAPFVAIWLKDPGAFREFAGLAGSRSGDSHFDWLMFGMASTVAFSLVVQIGEQVDFLRFLPEKTRENRVKWWGAVLVAGPGWIVPGMLKILGGAFLAFLALQTQVPLAKALEPTQMYLAGFSYVFPGYGWAAFATAAFVIVSQVKINVTNAYAGSLAWSNFFARVTHSHPGRVVWLVFNVLIAFLLMTLGIFSALEHVLGLYANVAIAWVGALVADLVVNKPLGLSPRHIEFKRAHLYDVNPVGLGAMLLAAALAIAAYAGAFGTALHAFAPFIALSVAFLTSPLLAWLTRGRFYLARQSPPAWQPGEMVACSICENRFEAEDMASCPAYGAPICSLCCTLEARCHDRCKTNSRTVEQLLAMLSGLLPPRLVQKLNLGMVHYAVLLVSLGALLGALLAVVYFQESRALGAPARDLLALAFVKAYAVLMLLIAVCAWLVVLGSQSRRVAEEESSHQNLLLTREIDAHRRTDAALQRAKEMAEAANQAKTRYVTGMTHELRTSLNSILGFAQILMKDGGVRGPRREAVAVIGRSSEHLVSLVDGLLDLASIEAGRVRLDPAPLPLPQFLDDLERMVRPQAEAKGLVLRFERSGRIPDHVHADARRLRQILLNLLANAVKFTERGEVVLKLDYRRELAHFEVVDTGIGIAAEDRQRIFLPFERAAAGRRSGEPGTGLGLTITHLLTKLAGGDLSLDSEPGRGSRFSVRLYLRELAAPDAAPPARPPVSGYFGARRCILVVDDHPTQRQMLAGMLTPLGFVVREAAGGRECLAQAHDRRPDAILLDVNMDDLDGWETCRLLRERGFRETPIIMVSADLHENRPERIRAAQCQAFVGKPVMESELLDKLGLVLDLDWLRERAAPPPPLASSVGELPPDATGEMLRLARLGHVHGVREIIDKLIERDPRMRRPCAPLKARLDRFELDSFIDLLREKIYAHDE